MNMYLINKTYVTRSKYVDLIIFTVLLCIIFATSYRLRVYYQFTVADVRLVRINPDGDRIIIPTPNFIHSYGLVTQQPSIMWNLVEKTISNSMKEYLENYDVENGTQFDWIIRYSNNSFDLDKERIITFKADDKPLH